MLLVPLSSLFQRSLSFKWWLLVSVHTTRLIFQPTSAFKPPEFKGLLSNVLSSLFLEVLREAEAVESLLYLLTESVSWLERERYSPPEREGGTGLCFTINWKKGREFKISNSLTHLERARGEGTEIELESGRVKLNTHLECNHTHCDKHTTGLIVSDMIS